MQVHGDKPPPNNEIREYKPRGKEAVHEPSSPRFPSANNKVQFKMKKPFSNFQTETKNS